VRLGWRSIVLGVGIAPALAACGATAAASCTSIGCNSEVAVTDLTQVAGEYGPQPVTATLCVDGDCQTDQVVFTGSDATPTVAKVLGENSPPAKTDVGVTFRLTRDGKTLLDTSTTTQLTRSQPNGKDCGPICYQSLFTIEGGKLVPRGPSS
jgi:hypothetical protein